MSTQGLYGVFVGGQLKVGYNHYDSYPEGLGLYTLAAARRIQGDRTNYLIKAKKLKLVDESKPPSPKQRKQLARFADESAPQEGRKSWHTMLSKLQGDLLGTLDSGYMRDYAYFAESPLCQYAWIIDMDDWFFECYRGYVTKPFPPSQGRFALPPDTIFASNELGWLVQPIHLLGKFELSNLPSNDEFLEQIKSWYDASQVYFGERHPQNNEL